MAANMSHGEKPYHHVYNLKFFSEKYASLLRDVDREIIPFLAAINVHDFALHNKGYEAYGSDKYHFFIELEKNRFLKALYLITSHRATGTIVDLGCFIPYLPIALSHLGYRIKIVDKFSLYNSTFRQNLEMIAQKNGMEVFDLDIIQNEFDVLGKADVVLLMAVVEHLSGSPKELIVKCQKLLEKKSIFILDVPNIAELSKRFRLMRGRSPLPDYKVYYHSAYPFSGHNREMTVDEVQFLLHESGLRIEYLECYDCTSTLTLPLKARIACFLKSLPFMTRLRDTIIAMAALPEDARMSP